MANIPSASRGQWKMMEVIDTPDWSVFRGHIEKYLARENARYESIVSSLERFAFLPHSDRLKFYHKILFPTVDHVPPCLKYMRPANLNWIVADPEFDKTKMVVLDVDIKSLIHIDHEHFLNLHPVRYDTVKEAIAEGEVDMPIVKICSEGFPRVDDGRHRIVSTYKYGFSCVKILVPKNESREIVGQLSKGFSRPSKIKEYSIEDKTYNLDDFTHVLES